MKVMLVDKKKNQILCKADILFGLDVLIVEQCESLSKKQWTSCSVQNCHSLQDFLYSRAVFNDSHEMDEIVLKKLGLLHKKYLFGRMSEACVLYAMLNNFEKDEDNFALYPIKDELVSMFAFDNKYTNLYLWRTNYDFNA